MPLPGEKSQLQMAAMERLRINLGNNQRFRCENAHKEAATMMLVLS
jgi:hypothetical protein